MDESEVHLFKPTGSRSAPFSVRLVSLKDRKAAAAVDARMVPLRGNLGEPEERSK